MDKTRRMSRIFKGNGKSLIVAMDHGTFNGASPAIENPGETIKKIVKGGADAAIVNLGVAKKFAKELAPIGLIARLDMPPTFLGKGHDSTLIFDVEYALRLGADAVIINVGIGNGVEHKAIPALAKVVNYCDSVGMPLCAEVIPGGFDAGMAIRTLENVARCNRIVCELGPDFIKTPYVPGFKKVVKETFCPLVILGGPKTDNPEEFLGLIKNSLDEGALGVAMGRNIWGAEDPVNMTRAIASLIHENASVDEAYGILKGGN
ncbi:class I fructose-bisphosphate aldolase [Schnuerera ultunensis]|uniref:class I fructose-bisphosphate aldolase n=1 Tax=Schnuerera ultunensis TaxID=45497 RepID=UPI0004254C82|nr:deoxyribose-phosphate aldolase [Schnuerera ultunensis]